MQPGSQVSGAECTDWLDAQPALAVLHGKWTLPIMHALQAGPCRHRDLARLLGSGVSSKVLSATLRRLVHYKVINRQVIEHQTIIYALTPLGRSLHPVVAALSVWSRKHRGQLPPIEDDQDLRSADVTPYHGSSPPTGRPTPAPDAEPERRAGGRATR